MNDMNSKLPPAFEDELNLYFSTPVPDPQFVSVLEQQLLRQYQTQSRSYRMKFPGSFRTRPYVAILLALLALLAVTGAVYAIGRFTGFIPGFGFTSESGQVYVLNAPVTVNQNNITLEVVNAVSDESRIWLELYAHGLKPIPTTYGVTGFEYKDAYLEIDGEITKMATLSVDYESITFEDAHMIISFPPVKNHGNKITFTLENLAGEKFIIPLVFRLAKPEEVLTGVPLSDPIKSASIGGMTLKLDQVIQASEKTILQVSLESGRPEISIGDAWQCVLTDADGSIYPLLDITPVYMDRSVTQVYQTFPFNGNKTLHLSLAVFPKTDSIPMMEDFSGNPTTFSFDPGKDPLVGQIWEQDRWIRVGEYSFHLNRITLVSQKAIRLDFDPVENVTGLSIASSNYLVVTGTGGNDLPGGGYSTGIQFSEIPDHSIELFISDVFYLQKGEWVIEWLPNPSPLAGKVEMEEQPTVSPALTASATPIQQSTDATITQIQLLGLKFEAPYQTGPGWVHMVNEQVNRQRSSHDYPPPFLHSEDWYEIDSEGWIQRSVHLDTDQVGQILQKSATIGNYSINLTYGDSGYQDGGPYKLSLSQIPKKLEKVKENGTSIKLIKAACDNGQDCLLLTLFDAFISPQKNPDEEQAFIGAGQRYWMDPVTGEQEKSESFWLMEDGSEEITSTISLLKIEKISSAPQEILNILNSVVLPQE